MLSLAKHAGQSLVLKGPQANSLERGYSFSHQTEVGAVATGNGRCIKLGFGLGPLSTLVLQR